MATYGLNPNGLLDTSDELRAVTNRLDTSLGNLDQAAQAFQRANQGHAISTYGEAHKQWTAGMQQMHRSLAKAGVQLDAIRERYVLADNRGAALFDGQV